MELKHYDNINGKYSEVILFNEYEALFFDGRIDRNTLPAGSFLYEIGHDDEDLSHPEDFGYRILANFFGTVITYKPIHVPADGFRQMMNTDFEYGRKFVKPDEVDEWLREKHEEDNNSEEVFDFINRFIQKAEVGGIEYGPLRNLFMGGYCFYFASMLKAAFNRGEIYIVAPFGHVVWRDTDNRYYDIDGEYIGVADAMIPVTDPFCAIKDFKHLGKNDHLGASKDQIEFLINKYEDRFPNR